MLVSKALDLTSVMKYVLSYLHITVLQYSIQPVDELTYNSKYSKFKYYLFVFILNLKKSTIFFGLSFLLLHKIIGR